MRELTTPFLEPMRGWTAARQLRTILLFVLVVFPVAAWEGFHEGRMFDQPDADHYMAMAEGKPAMMPFASRQLAPIVVRALTRVPHISIPTAFETLGELSLLFFLLATVWLLVRSGAPRWTLYALGGLMFWAFQFNSLAMPDLLYAALLCCFLLLLHEGQIMAACVMIFPMTVSRESTMLTLVCFFVAGWKRLKIIEIVVAVAALVAASALVKRLTLDALPNNEHISPMLYMAAKMPWNFLRNVLGLGLWSNVSPDCGVPKWQMPVHFGAVHAIGVCGFYPAVVEETFGLAMVTFGLLPLMVWTLRRQMLRTGGRGDLMLRFALVYGMVSFVIAPLLGESFSRLYGYSWPLYLVALPLLLGASGANFKSAWAAIAFLALHLFLSWSMTWAFPRPLFWVAFTCWILGWMLLRRTFRSELPKVLGCDGAIQAAGSAS